MKTVHELNLGELDELRESYFAQLVETDADVLDNIQYANQIPMEDIIAHYEGVYFSDDDFFCNIEE
jgi:hypothetical protein